MIWQLALLQICFFGLLVFVLQKFFHGNLVKAINRIEVLRQKTRKKEEELKGERLMFLRHCEERLRAEENKISEMRKKADFELKQVHDIAMKQLEFEKETLRSGYEQQIKNMQMRMREESGIQASRIACELVKSTLTEKMRCALHKELCSDLLSAIDPILPKKIKPHEKNIRVVAAFNLAPAEKKSIQDKIAKIEGCDKEIELKEDVDAGLVAGFVLYIGDNVIDGSLKNHLEKNMSRHGKQSAV